MSELLFVYGSLKRGYWNHHYMKDCEFLCRGVVHNFSAFNVGFPIIFGPENTHPYDNHLLKDVRGELWEVDSLDRFDRLENEGSLYNRVQDTVWLEGMPTTVWLYVGHPDYKDIRYKAPLCYVNSDNEYEWRG